MGRVKDFYHEEICARANGEDGPEPDDLEMLQIDAEMAMERYQRALDEYRKKHNQRGSHEPV